MKKYLNQQDMRDLNLTGVFSLIKRAGPLTRRQIEAEMSLSWGAVSNITALLLKEGYVKEVKATATPGAGRTPIALCVNTDGYLLMGLDVNRSGLGGVLTDLTGAPVCTLQHEPPEGDREEWIAAITALIRDLLQQAGDRPVMAIGIAMQGAVDADRGIAATFPAAGWQDVPLAAMLSDIFSLPVYLEHDPDCLLYAALAERRLQDAILLRIDRGIGMAVMLEGQIWKRFGALEIGATVNGGLPLQEVATTQGMSQRAGRPFRELAEAAHKGEPAALALFEQAAAHLGAAIANAVTVFNVSECLLCGKMLQHGDLLLSPLAKAAKDYTPGRQLCISTTDVGNAAIGAAKLAAERHIIHID